MTHHGEERTNGIRYRFNPSMRVNFQGTKISSVTDSLLVREILRGWGKYSLQALTHRLGRFTPFRRTRVIFWMMDSATSLFDSAQNDRGGGKLRRVKVFGLKPTKRKSGAMCMS